jgi:hypothetical protein
VFISADVEADGPIPGPAHYSMLSFGLAVAGSFDGDRFEPAGDDPPTFYAELAPISERFEPATLAVSGLDRDRLAREGRAPAEAMSAAADWVRQVAGQRRPVMVAYPAPYDWMWLAWYFGAYASNPFGHSGCLDIKTLYQARAGVVWARAVKRHMPPSLRPGRAHTHNALDDALEQAELFANIWAWDGAGTP